MKILITDPIDDKAVEHLRERGLEVDIETGFSSEELIQRIGDYDGLIIRSGTTVGFEVIEASHLQVIGRAGVGIDNIDLDAATRKGIAVMNTPTGNTNAAVEHTWALLLSMARKVPAADASLRSGAWKRTDFVGVELYGKTLGIIGLGRIGSRVATRGRAFGMDVVGFDPFVNEKREKELGIELVSLDDLFSRSDFISLHVPRLPETEGLISADRMARMKRGACLINCARGGLVDEEALAEAVKSGHLGGAALDVYQNEPLSPQSPLLEVPDIVLTPHLGASTVEAKLQVGLQIARQVGDALQRGIFREAVNLPVRDWATFDRLRPWFSLAERLGCLAAQFVEGATSKIRVEFGGHGFEEMDSILGACLKGFLQPVMGKEVNAINASVLATERGLEIDSVTTGPSSGYSMLLSLEVDSEDGTHRFSGTIFQDRMERVVHVDGYDMEFEPLHCLLFFRNYDRPGVIGAVGSHLGQGGTNIAQFQLGRNAPGGVAMAVLNLDSPASLATLESLRGIENMQTVRQIVLGSSREY
ncbi:MAG: phosphoglycerate dehydrogenase [Planctomycetota bacterium]|nr:phosphoglycerate dehydrogenase [Planctomycetota bacterium]